MLCPLLCLPPCRYFRYTGMILPLEYNTMAFESLDGDVTVGGVPPRIVHFTGVSAARTAMRDARTDQQKRGYKGLCRGIGALDGVEHLV